MIDLTPRPSLRLVRSSPAQIGPAGPIPSGIGCYAPALATLYRATERASRAAGGDPERFRRALDAELAAVLRPDPTPPEPAAMSPLRLAA